MRYPSGFLLLLILYLFLIILPGGADMVNPKELPEINNLPELMRFENGEEVKTPEDWARRRKEILTCIRNTCTVICRIQHRKA